MKNNIRINVIVNIIRTLVLTFLSFITFPWVCRYLGESMVGLHAWCNTFVAYFLILAKIGIPNLALRECVKVRDNKALLSNKVQSFFLLQLISTIASFSFMTALVFSIPQLTNSKEVIFILALNFLTGAFSFEWVFIALEKQFYMSVRSIIVLTISAVMIVAFVKNPDDNLIYALCTILVTAISSLVNVIYVRKYISFKKTMPYNLKQYFRPLLILCTVTLLLSLYDQTDTFILGFIDPSKVEVASYSVGIKGIDIIIGIITALSTVFIPRSAFYYQKEDKRFFNNLTKYSINICLFIVLPAIVTMTILSFQICGLISGNYDFSDINGDFLNAPTILMVLSSMMLTYSIGDIIYGQILLPMKKENLYLIAIGGGFALNIGFSLLFGLVIFKEHPAIGVAIGTSITDLLILIYLVASTWKWVKSAIFNRNTLKLLIGNALVAALTIGLKYLVQAIGSFYKMSNSLIFIIQLVGVVIIGGLLYILVLRLMKEDLVYSFVKHRKEVAE